MANLTLYTKGQTDTVVANAASAARTGAGADVLNPTTTAGSGLRLTYAKASRRDIQALGVTPDGTDQAANIQAAFDAARDGGYGVVFTPGLSNVYRVNGQLLLDRWNFEVAEGVTILVTYASNGGTPNSCFRNRDLTTDVQGGFMSIRGRIRTADTTVGGNLFAIRCSDLYVKDFICDQFGPSCRVIYLAGDNIKFGGNVDIKGGTGLAGSAGIRFAGGKGLRTDPGGKVVCGDDSLIQFVPPGPTTDAFYGRDIVDCWVDGWYGKSLVAKGASADLQNNSIPNGDATITTNILRSGWRGCTVEGGSAGVNAQSINGIGTVDVEWINGTIVANDSIATQSEIRAFRETPTGNGTLGSVRLTVRGGQVSNPLKSAAGVYGDATLRLLDADLPRGRTANVPVVNVQGGWFFGRGGVWDGAGGNGTINRDVVTIAAASKGSHVDPAEVIGIGPNGVGVNVYAGAANVTHPGRTRFAKSTGSSGTVGLQIASGVTGTIVRRGSDYRGVDTAFSNASTDALMPLGETVYQHGPPTNAAAYPVGTFVVDIDDGNHLYEIGA